MIDAHKCLQHFVNARDRGYGVISHVPSCKANRELPNKACVESIADQFSLSPEDRAQLLPSGKQTIIANRVHWAATYMVKAGLLDRPKRGTITATDRGRVILSKNLQKIDNKFLEQFQEFQDFQSGAKDKEKQTLNQLVKSNISETVATPEEQIEIASQEMNSALRDELLARIIAADPTFFGPMPEMWGGTQPILWARHAYPAKQPAG